MKKFWFSLVAVVLPGIALVSVSAVSAEGNRKRIPTPHEIHAFDQVLYIPNSAWTCNLEDGCVVCKNTSRQPAIAEVKASFKRTDADLREDVYKTRALNLEIREHCVYPGQEITACLSGYVIEPEPGTRPNPDGIRDPAGCPALP